MIGMRSAGWMRPRAMCSLREQSWFGKVKGFKPDRISREALSGIRREVSRARNSTSPLNQAIVSLRSRGNESTGRDAPSRWVCRQRINKILILDCGVQVDEVLEDLYEGLGGQGVDASKPRFLWHGGGYWSTEFSPLVLSGSVI